MADISFYERQRETLEQIEAQGLTKPERVLISAQGARVRIRTEAGDVEADGWVKVSNGRYRSRYRMTPAQRKTMRAIGVAVDNETERMLPHWRAGDTSPAETANLGADRDDYKRGP